MIIQGLVIVLLIISHSNAYAEEFSKNLSETIKITDDNEVSLTMIKSQNLEPTMKDMTVEEFKKIVNDSVAEIGVTDYTRATFEMYTIFSSVIIGGLLGFTGSLGVELVKKIAAQTKIRKLCLSDLDRLEKNLRNNFVVCHEININRHERHNFINGINTIPDLENLQNLGASQQFNFWLTIISSTYLIQLKSEEIGKLQTLYDLTMKYNRYVEHLINGIPAPDLPYVVRGAKQTLAQEILVMRNPLGAEVALVDLCNGLMFTHQALYDEIISTIKTIHVKDESNSLVNKILNYCTKHLRIKYTRVIIKSDDVKTSL